MDELTLYQLKVNAWTELAKKGLNEDEVQWGDSYITKALEKLIRLTAK